jgi:hypothetical protein
VFYIYRSYFSLPSSLLSQKYNLKPPDYVTTRNGLYDPETCELIDPDEPCRPVPAAAAPVPTSSPVVKKRKSSPRAPNPSPAASQQATAVVVEPAASVDQARQKLLFGEPIADEPPADEASVSSSVGQQQQASPKKRKPKVRCEPPPRPPPDEELFVHVSQLSPTLHKEFWVPDGVQPGDW